MEELEQLETSLGALLAQMRVLKEENCLLREQSAQFQEQNAVLAGEKQALLATAQGAERLRAEVLHKIDDLLRKIVEHDSIG